MMTSRSKDVIIADETASPHAPINIAAKLNAAIADLIHDEGLNFDLSEKARFQYMICLAKFAPPVYEPPKRKLIDGRLLVSNHEQYLRSIKERLSIQQHEFGLSLMGDGATVKIMPMVNMLCAGVHEPAGCLEIADCTGHLEYCGNKDARYIADQFKPHMSELNPNGYLIDCIFFYGASNVQKAGSILQVMYPRTTVLHGAEHVVSLFFKDLSKLPQVQDQILRHRFIYRVFGSGSMHLPYALFHKQTRKFNNGRDIGLLRAADTRMAGYFMAMHRDL
jgi:hypothetical protein